MNKLKYNNYEEKAKAFKKETGLETPYYSGFDIGSADHGKRMKVYLEWLRNGYK